MSGDWRRSSVHDDGTQSVLPVTVDEILEIPNRHKIHEVYLKEYWKLLLVIAVFYAVPSIQFVTVQYMEREKFYCYYNFDCAHRFLSLEAFNNVISNVGYVILGVIFLLIIRVQDKAPKEGETQSLMATASATGLHTDRSLYYSVGISLVLEGIFSALYHVCPSKINFQFDTTFMTIGAGLLFITLYQKRQPTIISGVYRTYGFFGALVLMNVLSLAFPRQGTGSSLFWTIVLVVQTYLCITGSLHLYYFEKLRLEKSSLFRFISRLAHPTWPRAKLRFAFLFVGNIMAYFLTISTAVEGYTTTATQDFPSVVLSILVGEGFLYLAYYITMKYRSSERVYIRVWALLIISIALWAFAIFFYNVAVSNKFLTPEESRELNKPCVLFHFFDDHDVWHFLSACGVFSLFLAVYLIDLDIEDTPRNLIRVF